MMEGYSKRAPFKRFSPRPFNSWGRRFSRFGSNYKRSKSSSGALRSSSYRKSFWRRNKILPHSQVVRNRLITPVTFVKLKYTPMGAGGSTAYRVLQNTGTGGVFGQYTFRGNDIYDPDFSGTGGQPTGRDEYYAFYGRCTVLASRIRVTFVNQNTLAYWKVGVVPTKTATWNPAVDAVNDFPAAKSAIVTPTVGGKGNIVDFVNFYRTSTILGISEEEVRNNPAYSQDASSLQGAPWYWLLYSIPADSSGGTGQNVNVSVEIDYYCMFKDRIELAQS